MKTSNVRRKASDGSAAPVASGRQIIFVLGMHRSGTSALTGTLASLGAAAPRTLISPTKNNPKGYFESTEFMRLHDGILASAGGDWKDWDAFNHGWLDSPTAEAFLEQVPGLLDGEFGGEKLIVVKDPRICRFLPFWLRAAERMGDTAKAVLALRQPEEVARSLQKRNGMGRSRALLVWLRHTLDAEFQSRGISRCVVPYQGLLDDWRRHAQRISSSLSISWPRWSSKVEFEIDSFLAPELKHHITSGTEVTDPIGKACAECHAALSVMVDAPEDQEAREVLDRIRNSFNQTSSWYGPVVRDEELELRRETAKARHELKVANDRIAEEQGARQLAVDACEAAKADFLAMKRQLEEAGKHMAAQVQKAAEVDLHLQRALEEREGVARRLASLEIVHAEASARSDALASQREALLATLGEAQTRISVLEDELRRKAAELAQSLSDLGERDSLVRQQEEAISVRESLLQEMRVRLAEAESRNRGLKGSLAKSESRAASLMEDLSQLRHELAHERSFRESIEEALPPGSGNGVAKLRRLLAERVSMEGALKAASVETARYVANAERLGRDAERLRAEIAAMGQSLSWRITSPLRYVRGNRLRAQRGRDVDKIRSSTLFNASWYLERYPDVAESGIDPAEHYLEFGSGEGRNPGPDFSTSHYFERHPELDRLKVNALLHHLRSVSL